MIEQIFDKLNIPSNCKVDRKVFKKQYLDNFPLKANEKKLLTEAIDSITLKYILSKDNINIQPYINDEYDYETISFIQVDIKDNKNYKKIAQVINILPRPIVLFMIYNNQICINVTLKRVNQNDKSKLVNEEVYFTHWINLEEVNQNEKEFIQTLDINTLSFNNFYVFYKGFLDKILSLNLSKYSGTLSKKVSRETLDRIILIEDEIVSMKNQIKKENDFSIKVNLNVELKKLNDKLTELKSRI